MTFWNEKNVAPIQQHHFTVEFGNEWLPYEVKSVTMPQLEISEGQYRMGNHYYKYPGTSKWNDVVITVVDTGDAVDRVFAKLVKQGYYHFGQIGTPQHQKPRRFSNEAVVIRQNMTRTKVATVAEEEEEKGGFLSALGFKKKESKNTGPGFTMTDDIPFGGFHYGYNTWYLHGCWIKSVNFGTHDYSSDELITIEITVAYDWAEVRKGEAQNSQLYKVYPVDEPLSPRAERKQNRIAAREARKEARKENREARRQQRQQRRAERRGED